MREGELSEDQLERQAASFLNLHGKSQRLFKVVCLGTEKAAFKLKVQGDISIENLFQKTHASEIVIFKDAE